MLLSAIAVRTYVQQPNVIRCDEADNVLTCANARRDVGITAKRRLPSLLRATTEQPALPAAELA